jgi:ABC-type multidrug transport system, ATPase component
MNAAIELQGLSKLYGEKRALDRIDLRIEEGSIFGFLGPNGAGKTTTLRILAGLARSTEGKVTILGRNMDGRGDAASAEARSEIGFLPDVPGFYDWMTAREFLEFAGSLFAIDKRSLGERVDALMGLAGLEGVSAPIGTYSRGMKQRLGVAQALINAPRLLLLDEPTSALDPVGRKEVLDMLASLKGRTTVFFSTHILADVERICDAVAILDRGRVLVQAPIEELKRRYGEPKIVVEVESGAEKLAAAMRAEAWATSADVSEAGEIVVAARDAAAARRAIPAMLAARSLELERFEGEEIGLEDVFVKLVSGGRP